MYDVLIYENGIISVLDQEGNRVLAFNIQDFKRPVDIKRFVKRRVKSSRKTNAITYAIYEKMAEVTKWHIEEMNKRRDEK